MEVLYAYWSMPLASRLTLVEQARLLALVFALVFVSVVVLHLFLPGETPAELLLHAGQIALTYLLWFALLSALVAAALAAGWVDRLRVWHVWTLSALTYVLGYFAVPFDDPLTLTLHHDIEAAHPMFHFLRLVPVWLAVTWVFTETYVGRSRRAEIARLARLNERLAGRSEAARDGTEAGASRVQVESGRTRIDLPAAQVSHVSVDDHYCYLFHHADGQAQKVAVGMPLKALLARLPDGFVQIHRSHAVNVTAVAAVERRGRGYWLRVAPDDHWLPVSRHRVADVLPQLESTPSA